ncbi:MAG TPA: xylose isomerase, partial [Dongiaceae bacterium]
WDTDQFPNNIPEQALALYYILQGGGFTTGGLNFDAKIRRQSIDPLDLLHGHVGGIDTSARALLIAEKMITDGAHKRHVDERYAGWNTVEGKEILAGKHSLADLAKLAETRKLDPQSKSGRQEYLENLVNSYL